jgi:hypothetical protein
LGVVAGCPAEEGVDMMVAVGEEAGMMIAVTRMTAKPGTAAVAAAGMVEAAGATRAPSFRSHLIHAYARLIDH